MSADSDSRQDETNRAVPAREIWMCPHCRTETYNEPFGGFWRCPSCRAQVFPDEVVFNGEGWL